MDKDNKDTPQENTKITPRVIGRPFTSEEMKGNQNAKKDWTKEKARHVASQELAWAVGRITQMSIKELKEYVDSGDAQNESLFTYQAIKKAIAGDQKAMSWLMEMSVGRPRQQIEHSSNPDNPLLTGVQVSFKKPEENGGNSTT